MTEHDQLIAAARSARDRAHAPYSRYTVGAALRSVDGEVFVGSNIENASYGLTICAERAAIAAAVSAGARHFDLVAIATRDGAMPCGACRQVLREFGADLRVIAVDEHGRQRASTLEQLLPQSFGPDSLP